jgi:hypothetical protein
MKSARFARLSTIRMIEARAATARAAQATSTLDALTARKAQVETLAAALVPVHPASAQWRDRLAGGLHALDAAIARASHAADDADALRRAATIARNVAETLANDARRRVERDADSALSRSLPPRKRAR